MEMYLRRSSAFADLQPQSKILEATRRRTEKLVNDDQEEYGALRARIVWANPDDVVVTERYDTDHPDDSIDGTSHSSVCKPNEGYPLPWEFVETGKCSA
jgi:hypothetical protein